jgi:putative PIN family toxin of toxin-antitoxin system
VRLVLDTNVVFSALLWRGTTHRLLTAIRQAPDVKLFCSSDLLEELSDVLGRPPSAKRLSVIGKTARDVLEDDASVVEFVEPAEISPTSPDPKDDAVLACALAAGAEIVVSGDPHLLNLKQFHRMAIVDPAEAARRIGAP